MKETPHIREFSKNSKQYNQYNTIQNLVAREVVKNITFKPKTILDLGCGSGAIYKNIFWEIERFVGIDLSKEMLKLHPKSSKIILKNINFDSIEDFSGFDVVVSSSALQWSSDIQKVTDNIQNSTDRFILAIFTNGTFVQMREFFGIEKTFLKSYIELCSLFDENVSCEKLSYKLFFDNPLDMLRYIKKSGVSGGKRELGIKDIKRFINFYPHDYLEFEVLLAKKL